MGIPDTLKYRKIALQSSVLVLAGGCIVLLGWLANIELLKSVYPNFVSMKFNTALCFMLIGAALSIELKNNLKKYSFFSKLLGGLAAFLGLISFVQLFGYNFAIDEFFMRDTTAYIKGEENPGRMSPLTAICFLLSGLALLLIKQASKKSVKIYQLLLHAVTLIGTVAVLGYLFSIPKLYNFSTANAMALHTSILFIVFSISASLIYPDSGITSLFTGDRIGSVMARRLFTWIIPAVLVIGFIQRELSRNNNIPQGLNIAMLIISFLLICLACTWVTSKELNEITQKKDQIQENYRMSIEASPYALILSRKDGQIIHVNQETEQLSGYEKQELIGGNVSNLFPEDLHKAIQKKFNRFFITESVTRYSIDDNLYCTTKKGARLPVELIITPVKTSEGILALSSIIDVTERKHSDLLMQKHLRDLQQKNQEMEQFSFIASHDLQEPLRTVSNFIMLLEEDYPDQINGEVKEHLGTISEAVIRMKKLILNLLDFSRLGRDKTLVSTDVKVILTEVLADLKSLLKESNTTINYNPEELPSLYAYDTELRMLFQNLLNNAIKFRKNDTAPQISIRCRLVEGYYEFTVTDNGIGIHKKHITNIFNIFQRLHSTDEYQGYGIGLAHCKKIAEMHGGKIWVESEPGKGSTFKFTILNLKL